MTILAIELSRGGDGMIATDRIDTFEVKVKVRSNVNAVGAGDSLLVFLNPYLECGSEEDFKNIVNP